MNLRQAWIAGAATFALLFGGAEAFLRSQGHGSTVQDSRALWASRRAAMTEVESPVALLGASRMHYGFDMATWRERVPSHEPFMLAIDGSSPLPTLKNLADDESFKGLAIVSVFAELFEEHKFGPQAAFAKFYARDYHIGANLENQLTVTIEGSSAVMNPSLSPLRVAKSIAENGHLPTPNYLHQTSEREASADFLNQDPEWLEEHREWRLDKSRKILEANPPSDPETWARMLGPVGKWVEAIESRGGRVVFVCLPATGELWEIKEAAYPRDQYWSQLEQRFGDRVMHFKDIPEMAQLDCPDYSHVDTTDRSALTNALIDELMLRKVVAVDSRNRRATPAPGGR
ncbi:MAG: hypothetical protein AAF196_21005 [Planctomycetota bacterium]